MDPAVVGLEPNGRTVLGTTVDPSIERTGSFGSCTLKTDVPGSGRSWKHASGHRCGLGAQNGVVAPEREPGLYLGYQSALGIHRAGTQ